MNTGVPFPTDALPPFALALADLCRRRALAEHDLVAASAALVASERSRGHTGIHLADHVGHSLLGVRFPAVKTWQTRLLASGLLGNDGLLIGDGQRLALARDARAEARLAANVRARLAAPPDLGDVDTLLPQVAALFPNAGTTIDWQAIAAAACLRSRLTVITGGPGTGKTTTVAKVLALLVHRDPSLRLALCAPTGKAAARLGESVAAQLAALPIGAEVLARLPATGTVHRLLGYDPRSDHFRHGPDTPLAVDAVVLDEASMADLLLMDALFAALPITARLVILGDAGQLASVEAGYVLGDLSRGATGVGAALVAWCSALGLAPPPCDGAGLLANVVVNLRENFRFRHQVGIGALANALRAGDGTAVGAALQAGYADVVLHPRTPRAADAITPFVQACSDCVAAADPQTCLTRLAALRILTPLRHGTWGTDGLTALLESELRRRGAIAAGPLYRGRPLLITANDHRLGLFNGDVGVLWDDADGAAAWFAGPDGLRRIALARLPTHETAWVMTIHKAQGSEFDRVLLVLPPGDGPFLGRELIYTAITRARSRVELVADAAQVITAAQLSGARDSGLAGKLGS